jgi:hypothetical protein
MKPKKPKQEEIGSPLNLPEVKPGDVFKRRGPRPGFIKPTTPKELPSPPWTILRYRTARAEGHVTKRNILNAEVLMPLKKARELLDAREQMVKWTKLVLESTEDFNALMANPEWLVEERAKNIEKIIGTLHARLTNLKRTLE